MSEGLRGLISKALRVGAAATVATTATFAEGCKPASAPVNIPDKPTASASPPESVTNPTVSVQSLPEPAATAVTIQTPDQKPTPNRESPYIEPQQFTQEDKKVFSTTIEKYINLDDEPQLRSQLNSPLFDEQFQVIVNQPTHSLPPHTAYTLGNIQLSIVKDAQGKVIEENLLVGKAAKKSLKIQPPHWEPIKPVNFNGKIISLGDIAEFSPSEGNYVRYQQFNNGQLTIASRNTPFPQ